MKTVNLKLVGLNSKIIPNVTVDGQVVKCKKNEFGSYDASIQTDKEEIEIAFSRQLELQGKLWWLYAMISFIVSIFGIFEPFYDRKCLTMDCLFKVKLDEVNEIKIKLNPLSSNGKAVELETLNEFEEIKNEYKIDKTVKKRWIAILVIKIIFWIGLAILIGYFLAKYI